MRAFKVIVPNEPLPYEQDVVLMIDKDDDVSLIKFIETTRATFKPVIGCSVLHHAAIRSKMKCVRALLKHGCDVNDRTHSGEPEFYVLVSQGSIELIRLFLDYGANPNTAKTSTTSSDSSTEDIKYFITVLDECFERHRYELIRLLIDRGATEYCKDMHYRSRRYNMIQHGRRKCRRAAIAIVSLRQNMPAVDVNVLRLIGKHVWSTRLEEYECWESI